MLKFNYTVMNYPAIAIAGIFCVVISFLISCSNDPNCKRFRNGNFRLHDDKDGTVYIISRSDSTQLEWSSTTKTIYRSTIRWINDCEYEMHYEKEVMGPADSAFDLPKKRKLNIRILETARNYYIFEAKMKGVPTVYSDTMILTRKNFPGSLQ
jgi:hypothetical protein